MRHTPASDRISRRRVLTGALMTLGAAIGGIRTLAQKLQTHRASGVDLDMTSRTYSLG